MSVHSQFKGLEIHQPYHFIQESDPGAVGAGLFWLQVSTGNVSIRNDVDTAWTGIGGTASPVVTTKGDLYTYSTTPLRLGVGTNGQILTADSTKTTGLNWTTPSSSVPAWVTNHPDTPPNSPSSFDDEFISSATLPGGGSAIWTALNGSDISLSIVNQGLNMSLTPNLSTICGIYQNVPASGAYTITAKVSFAGVAANFQEIGLFLMDGSNKIRTWHLSNNPYYEHQVWTNPTSFSSTIFGASNSFGLPQTCYLRIHNDLTNFICYFSVDGYNWTTPTSAGVTTFLTPTKMGLMMYSSNTNALNAIFSWFRVTQP